MHLGAKLQKKSIDRIECWAVTSEECAKAAVDAIKASISECKQCSIPKGAKTPMNIAFVAELDDGREFGPKDITLHQEMIGVL